jgi:hypothetical protein
MKKQSYTKQMEKQVCPNCMKSCDPEIVVMSEQLEVRNESYPVTHSVEKCNLCDETFNSKRCPAIAISLAFDQYRLKHHYFKLEQLKTAFSSSELTLPEFSARIGIPDLQISRILAGALQSDEQNALFWKYISESNLWAIINQPIIY